MKESCGAISGNKTGTAAGTFQVSHQQRSRYARNRDTGRNFLVYPEHVADRAIHLCNCHARAITGKNCGLDSVDIDELAYHAKAIKVVGVAALGICGEYKFRCPSVELEDECWGQRGHHPELSSD